MTKIAVVGAGQAGCLAAHALHRRGYEVTLYTDKNPDDFLTKARPTGTAARFDMALEFERELGLEQWWDAAPRGEGVHLTFCPKVGNQLVTLLGRISHDFLAIDVRLQSATWIEMLDRSGANVEVENVTIDRLEEIAASNDLTMVAAGRRELRELFPRDEARSSYSKPQRYLAMVNVTGIPMRLPYAPWFRPVKFNFYGTAGEMFWVPWYSKGRQRAWSLVFEAKEGGPIDRFREMRTGEQCLQTGLDVIRELAPWDYEWARGAELCDENAWLVGAFTPEVRKVVGTLPSGRHVMALGDTAQSLDPIGGQGANNGNKMARVFVDAIVEHAERPFDTQWMESAMDTFWARHKWIEIFNDTLLEPLTKAGQLILIAQYGSTAKPDDSSPQQRIANRFIDNFNDPADLTPAFHDAGKANAAIRDAFGSTFGPLMRGRLAIGNAQLRQKLGRPSGHPGT
jgi:hypothetical protein